MESRLWERVVILIKENLGHAAGLSKWRSDAFRHS